MATLAVEILGGVCLCITGVSHWLHPEAWCRHFESLAANGIPGAFSNGLMHAGVGALFVATHPVFTGWSAILTYWALLVLAKGLLYLLFPSVGLRAMRACTPDKAPKMRRIGIPMVLLGLVIIGAGVSKQISGS